MNYYQGLFLGMAVLAAPSISLAQDRVKPVERRQVIDVRKAPKVEQTWQQKKDILGEKIGAQHVVSLSDDIKIRQGRQAERNLRTQMSRIFSGAGISADKIKDVTTGALNAVLVDGLTPAQIKRLKADKRIAHVDALVTATLDTPDLNPANWGTDRIDQVNLPLDSSHEYSTMSNAHIFILDDGVDASHPEFGGRVIEQTSFSGDGTAPCTNHGTYSASVAAGGTRGVARAAQIHDLKIMPCSGGGDNWMMVNAINHAVNANLPQSVINVSSSFYLPFSIGSLNQAVNNAVNSGAVFVTSSGNRPNYNSCNISPNSASEALTVGASSNVDAQAWFSTPGACTDLSAPGVDINAARKGGSYGLSSPGGTSLSSPMAAGVAASIWMENPNLTAAQVKQEVVNRATPNILSGVPSGTPNRLLHYKPAAQQANQPPLAVASINSSYVYSGRPGVQLSAASSSDPDNHMPLSFDWTETNHSFGVQDVETQTFQAPFNNSAASKTYYFDLKVTDSHGTNPLQSVGSSGVAMVVVPDACTPYNTNEILSDLVVSVSGSANSDFSVKGNMSRLQNRLQSYVTTAQTNHAALNGAKLWVSIVSRGSGSAPSNTNTPIPNTVAHTFELENGNFTLTELGVGPTSSFWDGTPFVPDMWYEIHTNLSPIENGLGMAETCKNARVIFRLPTATGGGFTNTRPMDLYDPVSGGITQTYVTVSPGLATASATTFATASATAVTAMPQDVRLRHKTSNQCLYSNSGSGNLFRHWTCWPDPAMVFEKIPASGGKYQFKHKISGLCVKASSNSGGLVTTATCSSATEFNIVPVSGSEVRLQQGAQCIYATNTDGDKTYNWGCWNDPNMTFVLDPA